MVRRREGAVGTARQGAVGTALRQEVEGMARRREVEGTARRREVEATVRPGVEGMARRREVEATELLRGVGVVRTVRLRAVCPRCHSRPRRPEKRRALSGSSSGSAAVCSSSG